RVDRSDWYDEQASLFEQDCDGEERPSELGTAADQSQRGQNKSGGEYGFCLAPDDRVKDHRGVECEEGGAEQSTTPTQRSASQVVDGDRRSEHKQSQRQFPEDLKLLI